MNSKLFKPNENYGIVMKGSTVQPMLVALTEQIKSIESEMGALRARIASLYKTQKVLENLRDRVWDAKSETELASLEHMEKNPVVLSEDPDYPESLRYSENDVDAYYSQDEEQ
jgi:hypothetical protein